MTTDDRTEPDLIGDERTLLAGFLDHHRRTLRLKCSGLDAAQLAHRAVDPSSLSLLGLLRHLADVERGWFRRTMAGRDAPPRFYSDDRIDDDFDGAAADPTLVDDAWSAWAEEVAFAERFVATAPDLGVTGMHHRRGAVSLRWVLLHMIEEYARHNGHADLLREAIDGSVGE